MSDPWADVREQVEGRWAQNSRDLPFMDPRVAVVRLLDNADALMAVKDALDKYRRLRKRNPNKVGEDTYHVTVSEAWNKVRQTLAALPEHLKGTLRPTRKEQHGLLR
jgi:hypothetical protein